MSNLDNIKNRLAAATPGPWRTWEDNDGRRGSAVETAWAHDADGADTELITDWCSPGDADLIAHAPEDIARLVKALEAVQVRLAKWEERFTGDAPQDVAIKAVAHSLRLDITKALDS